MSAVIWVGNILGLLLISGIFRDIDGIYMVMMSLVGYWLISVSLLIGGLPVITRFDMDRPLNSTMGAFFSAWITFHLSSFLAIMLNMSYLSNMVFSWVITCIMFVTMEWAHATPKPRYRVVSNLLNFVRWFWIIYMTYSSVVHSILLLVYLLEFF